MGNSLIVEQKNEVIYLTFNRPSVLNALNETLLLEIKDKLLQIKTDQSVRGVIFTGAGDKAFSAGADIKYLNQATPLQVRKLAQLALSVNHLIENSGKITMALINGFALGGGLELAESCMFRFGVPAAKLGHPEVRIGAVAGWGGTTRLPRLIGKGRATELLLTGNLVDCKEAVKIGLVDRVVSSENLIKEGEALLNQILQNSPIAVNLTWQAIQRGLDVSIDESTRIGADFFGLVASTEDFSEGTHAFLNKKVPRYKGK